MVASILKIIITRNTICDNLVSFPKSGHIFISQLAAKDKINMSINYIAIINDIIPDRQ